MPPTDLPKSIILNSQVLSALRTNQPVVALESAVITHGLPRPQNLELARQLEAEIRAEGATPATIAVLHGQIHIGLTDTELIQLAEAPAPRKISRRDYGLAVARSEMGGTTVAGTLIAAHLAGITVFATGGIGGVHREAPFDVSADLPELARTPMIVVCAGAKSILDLPATLEVLETNGVPILGYQTDEFPAFFSPSSGLKVTQRVDSPLEVAQIAAAHWSLGLSSAVLVVVPPPSETAIPADQMEAIIRQAVDEARLSGITGSRVTPFLLQRVNQLSGGSCLRANLALLRNNARIAAKIAAQVARPKTTSI